jgi:hypothetical protein
MSYATFNGWTIIPPPLTPGFRGIVLRMNDTVAEARSPFSGKSQVQIWPGADWWEAELELPPMMPNQTAAWQAWLAALQGKGAVFQIGDPSRCEPQNPVVSSAPVCDNGGGTNNLTGATNLVTAGWRVSQARILLPGDYLQIGYRLHLVLQPVSSDSGGAATINVWPSLREQPTDASAIGLHKAKGLFRLADNARQISVAVTRLSAVGFKCVEAR